MESVLQIFVYVSAAWPIVLVSASWTPWLRRGRIRERWWVLTFLMYTALLGLAALVHGHYFAGEQPPGSIRSYGWLGARASLGGTPMQRWLFLGMLMTIGVALRSVLKKGYWFAMSRRRRRF